MPLLIRETSEAEDISHIQTLAHAIWPEVYAPIISSSQIDYMLTRLYSSEELERQMADGQVFFLAWENEKPVGFLGITPEEGHEMKINKLYLLTECRGKGYGKTLVDFAEQQAIKIDCKTLILNVNRYNPALDFYTACGFVVRQTIDIPFGPFWLNDYIMEKTISAKSQS